MSEMKKLQPLMTEIREKYKDDKQKMNQELMGLYRTYKVNPMGGCLPMVLQIPVFFALYRMLYQAIELRHAPFFLWINDLSAPDRLFRFRFFHSLYGAALRDSCFDHRYGGNHAASAKDVSTSRRPHTGKDDDAYAAGFYLYIYQFFIWTGSLLARQQHPIYQPTVLCPKEESIISGGKNARSN